MTLAGSESARLIQEARRHHQAGQLDKAESLLKRVTKSSPTDPQGWLLLSSVQLTRYDTAGARRTLQRAIRTHPREAPLHHNLAMALRRESRFEEAHKALDKALSLRPNDPVSIGLKADILATQGRFEEAHALLAPALEGEVGNIALAASCARVLRNLKRRLDAIELLERTLASGGHPEVAVRGVLAQLAQLYDAEGEADKAFEAARKANEMRGAGGFEPEAFERAVDEMLDAWTREKMESLPRARTASEIPVFIVGMPRSGTSLVEQILASHPRVHGAGELAEVNTAVLSLGGEVRSGVLLACSTRKLTPQSVDRAGRDLARSLRKLGPAADRVTDKMPTDFLHLGPISLLCPGARVIHCERNAGDTALSCYLHQFGGNINFAQDLGHLGAFYRQYRRIMRHWREVLDTPILDVPYEELTADQEALSRRLVEHVGLEWDEACLRFHETERVTMTASNEQVRQPMYRTSVGKHERYAEHLAPFWEALEDEAS